MKYGNSYSVMKNASQVMDIQFSWPLLNCQTMGKSSLTPKRIVRSPIEGFISRRSIVINFLIMMILMSFMTSVLANETVQFTGTVIQSGCEYDYPPFCMVDENESAYGFSVELMREALRKMGCDVTFRVGPWAEVKERLERGEIDALPLAGRTPERESVFDFTFPYLSLHGAIVVPKGTTDIHDLDDLKGRRVAVMKGDNAEEFLRRSKLNVEIHTTVTFDDALRELSDGLHDAVVIQRLLALRLIQYGGITNLRIVDHPLLDLRQDFCFAVKEGNIELLALLNEGLAITLTDGTFKRLQVKWFAPLELPSDNQIIIGGDYDYPPYEFLDERGRPAGYNVDLTHAIARTTGLNIEIRLDSWSHIRQGLTNGDIDAVHGMFYSVERDLLFDFSPPHTVIHHAAVARKGAGAPPIDRSGFIGKRVVVMQGDIMHDWITKQKIDVRIATFTTQEDALKELAAGQHDYALVAKLPALYWIQKHGWTNLIVSDSPLLAPEYCYAVPHNQKLLLSKLEEGLKILHDTGEYQRIYAKWLGIYEKKPIQLGAIIQNIVIVILPLLLLLLASFIWSQTLRRQVKRRTAELQNSEIFYSSLVENLPQNIFRKDLEGKFTFVNGNFCAAVGKSLNEIIGKTDDDLFPPELAEKYQRDDQHVIQTGQLFQGVEENRSSCGENKYVQVLKTPIRDSVGNTIGIQGIFWDITENKKAEDALRESDERLRILFEKAADPIYVCEPAGQLIQVNEQACRMTGYTREEILRLNLFDIDSTITSETLQECFHSILLDQPLTIESHYQRKDGTRFPVEVILARLEIQNTPQLMSVAGISRNENG